MKSFLLLVSLLLSTSFVGASAFAQCQHPYCNGPDTYSGQASQESGAPLYNPQYCYNNNCYPGAYIKGAIDKEGDVASTPSDMELLAATKLNIELEKLQDNYGTAGGFQRFTASNYKPGLVRHIVLFRYGTSVSAAQKQNVISRFLALKSLAKRGSNNYIVSIETGSGMSGEGADQGFEQGFIVTFKSQGDRNFYVGAPVVTDSHYYDPAHQAFKDFVGPLLDKDSNGNINGAFVFDFSL